DFSAVLTGRLAGLGPGTEVFARYRAQILPSSSGSRTAAFQAVRRGCKSRRQDQNFPLRPTTGWRTLNAAIVVRIKEGGAKTACRLRALGPNCRCSSAVERRSHTAKVGCSNQSSGTKKALR